MKVNRTRAKTVKGKLKALRRFYEQYRVVNNMTLAKGRRQVSPGENQCQADGACIEGAFFMTGLADKLDRARAYSRDVNVEKALLDVAGAYSLDGYNDSYIRGTKRQQLMFNWIDAAIETCD